MKNPDMLEALSALAVEKGISCLTSIDTAKAVVEAMRLASGAYTVQPLPVYREKVSIRY